MSTIITDNPYTFTVADNMNINAVFEDDVCVINAYIFNPSHTITADTTKINTTGSGTYNPGDSCTLNITGTQASTYSYFIGWYDFETGEKVSTNKSYTFTVSKSQDLYALMGYTENTSSTSQGNGYVYWSITSNTNNKTITLDATDIYGNSTSETETPSSSSGAASRKYTNLPYIPDTKYLDITQSTTDSRLYSHCLNPFNLIHDQNHPLKTNGVFMMGLSNTSQRIWMFGPKEGDTIYLDSEFPFKRNSTNEANIQYLYFTQHTAPNFNIKMNLTPGSMYSDAFVGIYVPTDGVGYDSDWRTANFTYSTTPAIYKNRMR